MMTVRVDFYVLEREALADKYAYACRIANKAYASGLKVYVRADELAACATLDEMLWTFSQSSFIPHAICDGMHDVERYPVQIGCGEAPEGCRDVLISLKEKPPADYARFDRVVELIIAQAADKSSGRDRFRFYREQGVEPQTHKVPR